MIKKILITLLLVIIIIGAFIIYKKTHTTNSLTSAPAEIKNYDTSLNTIYIKNSENIWPPIVTTIDSSFTCNEHGAEIEAQGKTALSEIQGIPYCITTAREGATGSTYTTYTYSTANGTKTLSTTFTLKSVQCMNYDNPQQTECLEERKNFDPNILAYYIIENAK